MKTNVYFLGLFLVLSQFSLTAQEKTTVTATTADISDNLDLRAIASLFGDAENLEDFENKINNPKAQISNLDLNNDNYVDYLRVIESVEGTTHLVIIQAVLEKDLFQDVATIELERDQNNKVQIQVVGDVYMYGTNYIYEPIYVHQPIIYTIFWSNHYRPYRSVWNWNYYPSYYTYWSPYPVFKYRNSVNVYINHHHSYNYVHHRRCHVAYNAYYGNRGRGYETRYPNRSFSHRNSGYTNRYELENHRNPIANHSNSPRGNNPRRAENEVVAGGRNHEFSNPRTVSPRNTEVQAPRTVSPRNTEVQAPRTASPRNTEVQAPRTVSPRNSEVQAPRTASPRATEQTRNTRQRNSESGGRNSNSNGRNSNNTGRG